MDGDHDIDTCEAVTEWVLKEIYSQLYYAKVPLEQTILKPNMVIAGKKCAKQASRQEVAERTVKVLKRCVPPAVPGIAFLSGGQSDEDATAHLSLMNQLGPLPWELSFSYGRALQAAALKAWSGKSENVAAGQRAFSHRAKMNGAAALGKWSRDDGEGGLTPCLAPVRATEAAAHRDLSWRQRSRGVVNCGPDACLTSLFRPIAAR